MISLGEMDPWDWSVDQVVEALCQNVTWLQDAVPGVTLPDAGFLENALRENEINGFTLLTYVDDQILKSDFGLKAVAKRAAIRWAIGALRDRSAKYSAQLSGKKSMAEGESLAEHKIPKASPQVNGTDMQMQLDSVTTLPSTGEVARKRAGETFIVDKQGKKRRKLVLGAAKQESHDVTKFDFSKKLTVDQVFYGAAPFGEILKDDDDFGIRQTSNPHPLAAEYVYRHLLHFIGAPRRERLVRGNRQAVAIYPYKDGSQPADQPRSVTLLTISGSEAQATREDASTIEPDMQDATSGKTGEEDQVLPLYGDSDSEGEDEASLLDEMENDRLEDEALGISKHSPLTKEVVSATIESRVQEFVELWQTKKLPLRERTARTVWRKAKRRSDRILLVVEAQRNISRITGRLEKYKGALLADPWHSKEDIRKQCAVLEESVFQIQEQQFRISVWERATEPPAMPRATPKSSASKAHKKRPVVRNGDDAGDLVNSESDIEEGSDGHSTPFIDDEEMLDHNQSHLQRLASSDRHTPAGDSALCVGDDDVSMGDTMDVDTPAEPDARRELSQRSTVNLDRTGSVQSNTPASDTEASNVIDLSRMSISRDNTPATGPVVPINQDTNLTDDELAKLPFDEVRTWNVAQLEECSDRKRLIVFCVRLRIQDKRLEYLKSDTFMGDVERWLEGATGAEPNTLFDEQNLPKRRPGTIKLFVKLFVCWHKARANFFNHFYEGALQVARELASPLDVKPLKNFWKFLRTVILSAPSPTTYHPEMISSRKRVVQTSAVGRQMRESALERQGLQAEKVRLADERMSSLPPDSTPRVIINIGKTEDAGDVFVHPHIASRIKPHQISGVRFIWREVIEAGQGCLLAHTMGLGKTMQAITFLVAMTEAANSEDSSVSSQIPARLKAARHLIICPASLVSNWKNELHQWIPQNVAQRMGEIRIIESDARATPAQRRDVLRPWYEGGGIMLIGYEMLNNLVQPTVTIPLTKDFRKYLLEGPNLIIADEAHRFKSAHSKTRKVFEQFASLHRIAMTGSPLSNDLEEYWSMIDWCSPGYLGDATEFRAYFVEPIVEGLYKDSSRRDHRRALKCLAVLKREIEPKVNRADITVLKDELKPKVEFLITIPLSELQEKAYKLCVSHMLPNNEDVNDVTMWNWIHILQILCSHPHTFWKKVKERAERDVRRTNVQVDPQDDDAEPEEESQTSGLMQVLAAGAEKLFDQIPHLESPIWSYKTEILLQITQHAKSAGDRVLVFSQSIPSLDYLQAVFANEPAIRCMRLDGSTKMTNRPQLLSDFNNKGIYDVFLMSTKAGGIGFNIPAANRVVLFDSSFNPQHEEQAIGRVYRIGQQKQVYVYRLCIGGTFEPKVWDKALFKTQLASRVVDARRPERHAERVREYLFYPEPVEQQDVSENRGKDPKVLDKLLDDMARGKDVGIRAITTTETLMAEDQEGELDPEEMEEVEAMMKKDGGSRAIDSASFGRAREVEEQARLQEEARLAYQAQQRQALEDSRRRQQQVRENQLRKQLLNAGQPHSAPQESFQQLAHQPGMFTTSAPQESFQQLAQQSGMFTTSAPQESFQPQVAHQSDRFTTSAPEDWYQPQVAHQSGMLTSPALYQPAFDRPAFERPAFGQPTHYQMGPFAAPHATQHVPLPAYHAEQRAGTQRPMGGVNGQGPNTVSRSNIAFSEDRPIHSPEYNNVGLANNPYGVMNYPHVGALSDFVASRRVRSQEPQSQYVAENTHTGRFASSPPQVERDTRLGSTNGEIEKGHPDSMLYSGVMRRVAGVSTQPLRQDSAQAQSWLRDEFERDADRARPKSFPEIPILGREEEEEL
ncbi:hypothetical protein HDK64DRAFT_322859 [Phyllosticta capitalensis]